MAFAKDSFVKVEIYRDMKGKHLNFSFEMCFPLLFSQRTRKTTFIPSRTMKTTSKVQSKHTQSLHYMNIEQFFTCFSCIPPIKFHLATLSFALSRVIFLWTTCIWSRTLTALSNPTGKIHMELNATDIEFPHSPILHYAYSPLLEENNSANNRLPLGLFALFSRSWIFFKSLFKPSKNRRFLMKNCA